MLKEAIEEVLALQKHYSNLPGLTPEMKRRCDLIENSIPDLLRDCPQVNGFSAEGSNAMGLPSHVPWVRVFDRNISPSATKGIFSFLKRDLIYQSNMKRLKEIPD